MSPRIRRPREGEDQSKLAARVAAARICATSGNGSAGTTVPSVSGSPEPRRCLRQRDELAGLVLDRKRVCYPGPMARARLGDYLVGVEGLALLRHWLGGDPAAAQERIAEIGRFLRDPGLLEAGLDVPELDAHAGYAAWSGRYDELPNPLIRLEEPVVRRLLDDLPPGRALDAACGTGRHAEYLRGRGHRVVGVDASAEMLARARAKLPDVEFRLGALSALPLETASVDLAVCRSLADARGGARPAGRRAGSGRASRRTGRGVGLPPDDAPAGRPGAVRG